MKSGTEIAPKGKIWVCMACGKTSQTKYGFDENNKDVCMRGWDESCMLNSDLFDIDKLVFGEDGRVKEIK